MKITKLGSATVIIDTGDVKILTDPWLVDGAYYGSWCNYPPIPLDHINFNQIDYIYVSHIHPDHFDVKTFNLIPKDIPVLIHRFEKKFLKASIERIGFKAIELPNGEIFKLSENSSITIFACDNCDPSLCGHMFGCIPSNIKGSMQLDTLSVIKNEKFTLVNTNDCSIDIAKNALQIIKMNNPIIDFALVGYSPASLYPHCMMNYSEEQMIEGMRLAIKSGLKRGIKAIDILKPKYFMPFAGSYIIGGKYYKKNKNLPLIELQDAAKSINNEIATAKPVLLNFNETFDLDTEKSSKKYEIVNPSARMEYIKTVLSKKKYTYEDDEMPKNDELLNLFERSLERLKLKADEISFSEKNLNLYFDLSDNKFFKVKMDNFDNKIIDHIDYSTNYMRFKLDPRLLKRALMGPKYANWNNIEIGAHLDFERNPDVQKMNVHILLNSMHI
jgi:UDP-MurNAc hydroxylase